MVGKAQKSHGARFGLYGGCSKGVQQIHFFQAEHGIQFRSRPMRFLGLSNNEKGSSEARNFEVINGLQHVFEEWVERCKSASLAKGGTSKKRPSPHLHKVPTRSNKVSPRTLQTALVYDCERNLVFVTIGYHLLLLLLLLLLHLEKPVICQLVRKLHAFY
jgi:hypothetical protein